MHILSRETLKADPEYQGFGGREKQKRGGSPPSPGLVTRDLDRLQLQSGVLTDFSGRKLNVPSQSALEIRPIRNAYRYPSKPEGYQKNLLGAVAQTVHIGDLDGMRSRLPPPPRYKISSSLMPEEGWILRLDLRQVPWVPETFHARFPTPAESSWSHARKNLWYPGYKVSNTHSNKPMLR